MKGRRLEIAYTDGKPDLNACLPDKPGDYVGPITGYTADKPAVFFLLPVARDPNVHPQERSIRHVVSPPHVFTEEDDGTLTIRESILAVIPGGGGWHGYLTRGEWSEA